VLQVYLKPLSKQSNISSQNRRTVWRGHVYEAVLTWSPFQLEEIEVFIEAVTWSCVLLEMSMLIPIEWPEGSKMQCGWSQFRTNILLVANQVSVASTFSEVYLTRRRPWTIVIEPGQEPDCCKIVLSFVMPCILAEFYWRFGGIYYLCLSSG
jgi:hypothetical protein